MHARTSKICLIVFTVLLVLSAFLLSVDGDYWPWYAFMALFAIVPLGLGPRRYRILGGIALSLSGALIISDIKAGRVFQESIDRLRAKQSHSHTTDVRTNRSSEPPPILP